ncbi:universal stress protein [Shewanella sp. 6_MG-2023]|uniref:universal stress protein n=1 Tax=Shewanella sp. 6_MG-2023 TaxID=3062660 RepID=UPI0026E326D8|nr:universal stress protein [Shewanella sp. 6_MG-2023]MDO6620640.1 universal stress protein [Shewanella sp. 6_MG-2023]
MSKLFIISQQHQQQTNAIKEGINLAKQLGLVPEIMSYSYEPLSGDAYYNPRIAGVVREQVRADDSAAVKQQLSVLNANEVQFTNMWCKHLVEHVCEYVTPDKYAMMLKSIHESACFRPLDWQLIRHIKVPLMLLSNHPLHKANSILMALDLGTSDPLKQALNQDVITQAQQLAKATGCDLHLGYVVRFPQILRDMDIVNTHTLVKEAYQRYDSKIAKLGLDKEHVHILTGNADLCLFELSCRLKAQYLVIGARQREGIIGFMLGNTAESILERVRSNVLVVPHRLAD